MRTAILAAALLAAACGRQSSIVINLPGGPGATRAEPVRTLPAGREPAVVLESHAGSVTLRAAPPAADGTPAPVTVEATLHATEEKDLDRIRVRAESDGDGTVSIGWDVTEGSRNNLSVSFVVTAPPGSAPSIRTGAGSVEAEGFAKGLAARTGGGSIEVRKVEGDLALESGAGSIEVGGGKGALTAKTGGGSLKAADRAGDLRLESAAGTIKVAGGAGRVEAATGGGSIAVEGRAGDLLLETRAGTVDVSGAKGAVRAKSGGGSVSVEGDLSGECRAESSAGSVKVRIPASASLVVEGGTQAGSVETDLPLSVEGKYAAKTLRGTLGDGKGGTLTVRSGAGSVSVGSR